MTLDEKALQLHYEMQGKIEVVSRKPVCTREDLSLQMERQFWDLVTLDP